jgi:protein phosphatase PTC7
MNTKSFSLASARPRSRPQPQFWTPIVPSSVPLITAATAAAFFSTVKTTESKNDTSPYIMDASACVLPHPDKVDKGGEDAYFISNDGQAIGVADGVSAWSQMGIDPRMYSQKLMEESQSAYEKDKRASPVAVLSVAYKKVLVKGSSTACVALLKGNELHAVNVGDSGFMIIRNNASIFRTKEQQHYFNCPFQLGSDSGDTPEAGDKSTTPVQPGDLIVMASDGLWDNLFDNEIINISMNTLRKEGENCPTKSIATAIATAAMAAARNSTKESPFSVNAGKHGYMFRGGKLDDVTVLVARVTNAQLQSKL